MNGKVDSNAKAIESLKGQVGKGNTTIVNVEKKVENITNNIKAQNSVINANTVNIQNNTSNINNLKLM